MLWLNTKIRLDKCIPLIVDRYTDGLSNQIAVAPKFFEYTALYGKNSGAKRMLPPRQFQYRSYDQYRFLFSASTYFELEHKLLQ
jgi:hypothetical protein